MKDFAGKAHYPINLENLPRGWTAAFVGELCREIQSGFASGEHNSAGRGIPHLRPMNIDRTGRLDLSVIKSVAADGDARRLHFGDVLFNNTNSPVLIGKSAAVSRKGDFAFSNHMTRLRPVTGIDYEFLAHHLHYLWMGGYFLHRCSKHVNQASISTETLGASVPLAVPPAREQRRIVEAIDSYLSRLDDAVASLDRVQAKLKAYRASVLKAAVEGRLVPTEASLARSENRDYEPAEVLLARILKERRRRWEESELRKLKAAEKTPKSERWKARYEEPELVGTRTLADLPEGWCWATASALCTVIGDVDHKMPVATQRGIPYIATRDFRGFNDIDFVGAKQISKESFEQLCRKIQPQFGDILLSRYGTVGEVRLIQSRESFLASYSIAILKPADTSVSAYMAYALRAPGPQLEMRKWTRASAQPDLGLAHIRQLAIPLPPIVEQERVRNEVDRLLSIASKIDVAVAAEALRIRRLRQAVLKWAFEGKLVDQDANNEPAERLLARIRAGRAAAAPLKKSRGRAAKGAA